MKILALRERKSDLCHCATCATKKYTHLYMRACV
nr:MAG TPA: hypothetical protein [Caudoviricetes sp.]